MCLCSADFWETLCTVVVSFKFKLFQLNWIQFLVAVFSYGFHVIFAIVFTVC